MASEHITTELSDGILTVTLNRPEKMNAYTTQMGQEIGAALDRADRDDEVRVVIFTGAGRGFCAGADISDGGSVGAGSGVERKGLPVGGIGQRLFESHKPMIAAINGAAMGVGVTMTLPMDIRLCADNANSASSSPAAAWCRRRAAPGFCRASSACPSRWNGSMPAAP
jgi:enoyl-CoA hydratase/carnithine racemase